MRAALRGGLAGLMTAQCVATGEVPSLVRPFALAPAKVRESSSANASRPTTPITNACPAVNAEAGHSTSLAKLRR